MVNSECTLVYIKVPILKSRDDAAMPLAACVVCTMRFQQTAASPHRFREAMRGRASLFLLEKLGLRWVSRGFGRAFGHYYNEDGHV